MMSWATVRLSTVQRGMGPEVGNSGNDGGGGPD